MSTTVLVSVKTPSVSITVSPGSSSLVLTVNGQTVFNSASTSNPSSIEIPQGAVLGFSGTAMDAAGNPFANTVFYFFQQGPIPIPTSSTSSSSTSSTSSSSTSSTSTSTSTASGSTSTSTSGSSSTSSSTPQLISQSVTTDSKGNWSVNVPTASLALGEYVFWLDANPTGA